VLITYNYGAVVKLIGVHVVQGVNGVHGVRGVLDVSNGK
jgi:hypothetical protein